MKKSTIWTVCGVVALGAAVVYLLNKNQKEQDSNEHTYTCKEAENEVQKTDYAFEREKGQAANSIFERHNTAAQIIRDTLEETEFDENDSEHKVDFDEIDNNLDKLLEEE